jgi:biotin operon repressor
MSKNEDNSTKRPKLHSIQGNPDLPTVTPKVRRIAQPGEVLLPRAVAYRTDLKPTSRLVALWLYDHMQPGSNVATGSQPTIAEDLGIGEKSVRRAVEELWKKHIIMGIEAHNKTGGGYYLSYVMRVFPSEVPRKQRLKHKKQHVKINTKKHTKNDVFSPKADCPLCYGTGWHILENKQGAKSCDCKKLT